jgi:hypothetical protein
MRGFQGIEAFAQGRFFSAFAIIPWAALQRHVQNIVANEMWARACGDQHRIGGIRAQRAQGFGRVDPRARAICLGCGAKIGKRGYRGVHVLDRCPVPNERRGRSWNLSLLLLLWLRRRSALLLSWACHHILHLRLRSWPHC